MADHSYSLAELAEKLQLKCVGDNSSRIVGLATLVSANENQISFLANPRYLKDLKQSKAAAVIVTADMVEQCPSAALVSDNPYLSYAKATALFKRQPTSGQGVHPTAVVADSAFLASGVCVAANAVVGENVSLGENTVIGPNCTIGDNVKIGRGGLLHANVTLYHDVKIGDQCVLHSGCVIGADGFGFAPSAQGWQKIEQLGGVTMGNQVEVGANTTIDRGALDDTTIGNNVIIDNLVQIAHNVVIGDGTAIAGCAGVAGSTRIGKSCTIAGGVGMVGHITVADGVHITAMSLVTKSIAKAGSYSSGTPMMETKQWRKSAARFAQLDKLAKNVSRLFKKTD